MEMVICQEAPSHGKNIYGNLTAARHAPSKKVRYTRYYRFLRCAFLSVKQNYGKIRPRRAAVVYLHMSNLFSISKILSTTIGPCPTDVQESWIERGGAGTPKPVWVWLQPPTLGSRLGDAVGVEIPGDSLTMVYA